MPPAHLQMQKRNHSPLYYRYHQYKYGCCTMNCRLGPYHVQCTPSRPIWEVKQRRAWLVLAWVTGWEYHVPKPISFANFECEKVSFKLFLCFLKNEDDNPA